MNEAAAQPASTPATTRRVERSIATWLSGAVSMAVAALAGFFATPWLVRWLGDTQWGAWTVIGEWLGYLGLTQLALGPGALTVFLLRAHTGAEPGALTATAKRGLHLYALAALALVPVGLALAWWAPLGLPTGRAFAAPLRWAVGIAALGGLVLAPAQLLRSVLETVQRGYLVRTALLIQSLVITSLSLWWSWEHWGIIGMAIASFSGMLLGAGLWWWWARPWLRDWRRVRAAGIRGRELWHFNWPLIVALLGNQINALTDNTVVGLMLGPAAVAGFALTQSLPLLAGARLTDIGAVSWAPLGELRARRDPAFGARMVELAGTVLGGGLVLMSTLAAFNGAFVRLWVGARHYDGATLTWATSLGMAAFGLLCFFSWLIDTQGDTRLRLWSCSVGAAINLGLSLYWVRSWGVAGVATATLIAYLCTDAWFLPMLAVRHYGVPGGALARSLANAFLRGIVWAAAMYWLSRRLTPATGWIELMVELGLTGVLALAYGWVLVLRPADRSAWRARLQAAIRR